MWCTRSADAGFLFVTIKFTHHGAAGEVTGSCCHVASSAHRVRSAQACTPPADFRRTPTRRRCSPGSALLRRPRTRLSSCTANFKPQRNLRRWHRAGWRGAMFVYRHVARASTSHEIAGRAGCPARSWRCPPCRTRDQQARRHFGRTNVSHGRGQSTTFKENGIAFQATELGLRSGSTPPERINSIQSVY